MTGFPTKKYVSKFHSFRNKNLNDQGIFLFRQTRCFTVIKKGEEDSLDHIFEGINFRKFQEANGTRWAPLVVHGVSNTYKWPYEWVTGVITYNPTYRGYNSIYNWLGPTLKKPMVLGALPSTLPHGETPIHPHISRSHAVTEPR